MTLQRNSRNAAHRSSWPGTPFPITCSVDIDGVAYRLKPRSTQISLEQDEPLKSSSAPSTKQGFSTADQVLVAIRKIIQRIDINSRSLVKRVGLTGPQLIILQAVTRSEPVAIGEVAKAISLSQATVTGIVERLEKRNLVMRERSLEDRRKVMVKATDEGRALLTSAPPLMQEAFVDKFNDLDDWEQAMILSSLQRLVSLMDAGTLEVGPFLATGPIMEDSKN